MKKYFQVLVPTLASASILALAVACAPEKASDVVNARRGKPCDNQTRMCDQAPAEQVYGKLGSDTLLDELIKELDAVKDVNQKKANKAAAKDVRNIHLLIDGTKATVSLTNNSLQATMLTGELKDGKAELANEEGTIKASLQCKDTSGKCKTVRIDITKMASVETMIANGKVAQNQTVKAEIKTLEKKSEVVVKAVLRDSNAEISAEVDADIANKSDALKKIYDLFTAKSAGRQDQNTIKDIRVMTSEVANGKTFISTVILSNENEVIGLEGDLQIIGKETKGKTSIAMKLNVNANVLKSMQVSGEVKKSIMDSLKDVTLTSVESGNKLGLKFSVFGKDGKTLESLNSTLLLTQLPSVGEGVALAASVASVANKKELDAKARAESDAVSTALIYDESADQPAAAEDRDEGTEESERPKKKIPRPEDLQKTAK